ncbi:MAG TPA: DUF4230 domain-containing protein [Chloroflexi bacterium]|nr:MAG: hypothetical protein DRI46_01400 [Chloroflexota bacterium]HDD54796.1 DUF4230 domain-containing protein [Chloroflexota bacterium]
MKKWQWIVQMVLLLLLVGTGVYLVNSFQRTLSNQLLPVKEMAGSLSTQVAEVLHPTPTIIPDPVTIIHEVRSLARLETIKFSLEKIITAETRQGVFEWLVGDRLLFVAHGEVIAGVDLIKLNPEDLRLEDDVLFVTLPEAEIFVVAIDNQKSYVYDRETGIFTQGEVDLETEARRAAELEIEASALEDGILDLAAQNAESFLGRLFVDLGYTKVIFE